MYFLTLKMLCTVSQRLFDEHQNNNNPHNKAGGRSCPHFMDNKAEVQPPQNLTTELELKAKESGFKASMASNPQKM